jgi:hypothetical protein
MGRVNVEKQKCGRDERGVLYCVRVHQQNMWRHALYRTLYQQHCISLVLNVSND